MGDFFDTMTIVVVIIMVFIVLVIAIHASARLIQMTFGTNDFRQKVRFETKGYSQIK